MKSLTVCNTCMFGFKYCLMHLYSSGPQVVRLGLDTKIYVQEYSLEEVQGLLVEKFGEQ